QAGDAGERSARLLLSSGARLSGDLKRIEQNQVALQCPGVRESLVVPLGELQSLALLPTSKPESGETKVPAGPREGRLELAGTLLHGQLTGAGGGEHTSLI